MDRDASSHQAEPTHADPADPPEDLPRIRAHLVAETIRVPPCDLGGEAERALGLFEVGVDDFSSWFDDLSEGASVEVEVKAKLSRAPACEAL
jgi:hypothetical protein